MDKQEFIRLAKMHMDTIYRIARELYMVTYDIDADTHSTIEIRLKSPAGYKGDAKTEGIDQYKFYTIADFNIAN